MLQVAAVRHRGTPTSWSLGNAWDPTQQQYEEDDTIFLLDPDTEATTTGGVNGFIQFNTTDAAWQAGSQILTTPGKFRTGITPNSGNLGYYWAPCEGLLPTDQFTIEFWAKSDTDWKNVTNNYFLSIGDATNNNLVIFASGSFIHVRLKHTMGDGAGTQSPQYDLTANDTALLANTWHNVAVTYRANILTLYVDGVQKSQLTNVAPPDTWAAENKSDGFTLLGFGAKTTNNATHFIMSDLRISHQGRVPSQNVIPRRENLVVVKRNQPTGNQIQQGLRGGLHANHVYGNSAIQPYIIENLSVLRAERTVQVTPTKAGAPDADHPSLGHSGQYSYDWQVLDRDLGYITSLGTEIYFVLSWNPQITGGASAPFSGTNLTSLFPEDASISGNRSVPSDIDAFATICADHIYYATKVKKYNIPYVSLFDEPDFNWSGGSSATYVSIYTAMANAVRAVNSNIKIGGPSLAGGWTKRSWTEALMQSCATNNTPLDFIVWNNISANYSSLYSVRKDVDITAAANGMPDNMEMVLGGIDFTGGSNFTSYNYGVNDFSASYLATNMIIMQNMNVTRNIFTFTVGGPGEVDSTAGLVSSTGPWANLNVYKMWKMLEDNQVSVEVSGDPGIRAVASTDGGGTTTILVTSHHYRGDDLTVQVYVPGVSNSATLTHYVIDSAHSNAYDAGSSHKDLETVTPPSLHSGQLTITAKPRSVHLLVIR